MFSSIASFIFGSTTAANPNIVAYQGSSDQADQQQPLEQPQSTGQAGGTGNVRLDRENTIEVTSSTPSVTGNTNARSNQRNRNKRNRNNQKNNKKTGQGQPKPTPTITNLLTPGENFDGDLDEDDWFIVEKEDEEESSLPRTDSEEEVSVVESKLQHTSSVVNNRNGGQPRRRQQLASHSLFTGTRPQQHRNFIQRARYNGVRDGTLSVSTLSQPRCLTVAGPTGGLADGGVTQSLYVVSANREAGHNGSASGGGNGHENGTYLSMEESWFVTPPPCFTSIGPINMETSPFENLLIEHPSMSVYHSIRSAQEATESFVNLDLGVTESQERDRTPETATAPVNNLVASFKANKRKNNQTVQPRAIPRTRVERFDAAQLKQELLARRTQKQQLKSERQNLCRNAIKRANKVRDFQSKGKPQRRADMQHCKVVSGANNNRKCCF